MKVVINWRCGFSLSTEAVKWLAERGHAGAVHCLNETIPNWMSFAKMHKINSLEGTWLSCLCDKDRGDSLLVECVEKLGEIANGSTAGLKVTEVPDDVVWHIECGDDGREWVAEEHRTWD